MRGYVDMLKQKQGETNFARALSQKAPGKKVVCCFYSRVFLAGARVLCRGVPFCCGRFGCE